MKLSKLARLLDQPAWLKQAKVWTLPENIPLDDAGKVNLLFSGQRPPVRVTAEDTVLILRVFSEFGLRGDLIYLSVSGKHDANRLLKFLEGENCPDLANATILELGFEADLAGFRVPCPAGGTP